MLPCQDCEKYLEVYLDYELGVKESLDVEEHLRDCPACTSRAEAERWVRQFVHQHARMDALPEGTKLQIIRQAMSPLAAPGWWKGLRAWVHPLDFSLGVATAAVVALLWFLNPFVVESKNDVMTRKYVQEASMAYQAYKTDRMPLEVTDSNDQAVVAWFNRQMQHPLKIPCITDQATKLLGGRLCRLFDRKSATFVYKRNNADLFLFAFHGKNLPFSSKYKVRLQGQDMYVDNIGGRPVALWHRGGIVYSMVGDLNRDDLLSVASTLHYR
jgi:anti-sigma factor RsiW